MTFRDQGFKKDVWFEEGGSMYIWVIFPWKKNGKKAHCEVVLVVWDLIIGRSMSFIFLSLGVSCNSCEMGFSWSEHDLNLTVEMHFVSKLFNFSSNTLLVDPVSFSLKSNAASEKENGF